MKDMVASEIYDLVSLNVLVWLSHRTECDKKSSLLPRTPKHNPKVHRLHSSYKVFQQAS